MPQPRAHPAASVVARSDIAATPLARITCGDSRFDGFSGHPDCSDGSLTMTADRTCTATFNSGPPSLTVVKAGTGSGTVTSAPSGINCGADCTEAYADGTSVVLTGTAAAGSLFAGFAGAAGDCESQRRFWSDPAFIQRWQDPYERGTRVALNRLMSAADVQSGERVVDIGCGPGLPTLAIAHHVGSSGYVVGVDISEELVRTARERAQQRATTNVTFVVLDAQVEPFPGALFDVAISRNGLMFFDDPHAAFANIRRQIRAEGRLVFTCFPLEQTEESTLDILLPLVRAAHGDDPAVLRQRLGPMWTSRSLGDRDRTRTLLHESGFGRVRCRAFSSAREAAPGESWSPRALDPLGLDETQRREAELALRAFEDTHVSRGKVRTRAPGLVFSAIAV